MPGLERKLGLPEAVGLSLSIVGPSIAMAFNVSLVVRAAGRAAPLAFVIGTIALVFAALSFVSFSKRVAHAGSAYAYIGQTFGWRWGFVAGWTLLLTYLTYAAGVSALIGEPASGAFVLPIDNALYIGWVATSKKHRRMGLAELVIRTSLEDARKATGLERTILHATDAGLPVYTRMGYRSVEKFPFYSPETLTAVESTDAL